MNSKLVYHQQPHFDPVQRTLEELDAAETTSQAYSQHLFVALYDFHAAGEDQLSLRRGDQVICSIFIIF